MTSRNLCLIACLALLFPQLAAAQEDFGQVAPERQVDSRNMYEDIEIMRRLLLGKLGKLYAARATAVGGSEMMSMSGSDYGGMMGGMPGGGTTFLRDSSRSMQESNVRLEGVYLKGHGVVFAVNLPQRDSVVANPHSKDLTNLSSCTNCHSANPDVQKQLLEAVAGRPKPISEWEKTRRDVLGIKEDGKKTTVRATVLEICNPGTVTELILQVLADNGRHFSQLPGEENVTIAITFRDRPKSAARRSSPSGMGAFGGGAMGAGMEGGFGSPQSEFDANEPRPKAKQDPDLNDGGAAASTRIGVPDGGTTLLGGIKRLSQQRKAGGDPYDGGGGATILARSGNTTYRDYLLLGDLHMKQGKPAEALAAYERALASITDPKNLTPRELSTASAITRRAILDLHQKLAQAALVAGKTDIAKKWLDQLAALKEKPAPQQSSPQARTARPPLPSRLIISAEKSLLDRAGTEKLSLEQFKKAAHVQHFSPTKP